jgi:IMP cyclohydrolase
MVKKALSQELAGNCYPGRGIVVGRSEDGRYAVAAYFIMGRSANSRNRIFVEDGEGIRTQAFDPSRMEDPSLIIYAPVRVFGTNLIITNGDQTDTVVQGLLDGKTFGESLRSRTFEPDAPNYTPRISALLDIRNGAYEYKMNILKSADGDPSSCERFNFSYENPKAGEGHFLHTYLSDGDPLPSFEGEPQRVDITGGIDDFTSMVWENLNKDNKVSLFVRYIEIETGRYETRIVNLHQNGESNE